MTGSSVHAMLTAFARLGGPFDLDGGDDGDEIVELADVVGVVGIGVGVHLDLRVPVDETEQLIGARRRPAHRLAPVDGLALVGHHAALHEVDDSVDYHAGM